MSTYNPTCPDDCTDKELQWNFNRCNPNINHGQVDRIYFMAPGGASFTNWLSLAEWTARLALDPTTDVNAIQEMLVIGEKPEATGDVKELAGNLKTILWKTHTLPFDIDQTNQENYDGLRQNECAGNHVFWYAGGKYIYGGNDGIEAFFTMNDMIPKDRKELNLFKNLATWEAEFHPERDVNPML